MMWKFPRVVSRSVARVAVFLMLKSIIKPGTVCSRKFVKFISRVRIRRQLSAKALARRKFYILLIIGIIEISPEALLAGVFACGINPL